MNRAAPDKLTMLSFVLLALLALLLLWPLLSGGQAPHPALIVALLLARLGVQMLRARHDERLRRPASWAIDLILIGLLMYAASTRPA